MLVSIGVGTYFELVGQLARQFNPSQHIIRKYILPIAERLNDQNVSTHVQKALSSELLVIKDSTIVFISILLFLTNIGEAWP